MSVSLFLPYSSSNKKSLGLGAHETGKKPGEAWLAKDVQDFFFSDSNINTCLAILELAEESRIVEKTYLFFFKYLHVKQVSSADVS